jgi:dephospho-CoA kinase
VKTPVIAVTGGIASGKSTVCARFQALGRTLVDADQISRDLVANGQPALTEIRQRFGARILQPDGQLDRRALRKLVFADAAARADLQAILHPRIREQLQRQAQAAQGPYALIAVPLLVETGSYGWVRRVLLVDVPEPLQLERVMARDRVDLAQAGASLAAQATRRARWSIADDVIINDGPLDALEHAVRALDQRWARAFATPRQPPSAA